MIQNLSRELFSVADEHGGKLQNRVVFYCDELGTMQMCIRDSLRMPASAR